MCADQKRQIFIEIFCARQGSRNAPLPPASHNSLPLVSGSQTISTLIRAKPDRPHHEDFLVSRRWGSCRRHWDFSGCRPYGTGTCPPQEAEIFILSASSSRSGSQTPFAFACSTLHTKYSLCLNYRPRQKSLGDCALPRACFCFPKIFLL